MKYVYFTRPQELQTMRAAKPSNDFQILNIVTKMAKIKRLTIPSVVKDMEEIKLSHTAGRTYGYFGKQLGNLLHN
jgi:hypothetical protein